MADRPEIVKGHTVSGGRAMCHDEWEDLGTPQRTSEVVTQEDIDRMRKGYSATPAPPPKVPSDMRDIRPHTPPAYTTAPKETGAKNYHYVPRQHGCRLFRD